MPRMMTLRTSANITSITKTYGSTFVFDESTPSDDFSVAGLVNGDAVASTVTLTSAGAAAAAAVGRLAVRDCCEHMRSAPGSATTPSATSMAT